MSRKSKRNRSRFELFDGPEHRLWKRDRLLRQRVALGQTWRGCLGLAAMLHQVERTEYPTDRHALIPNDCVTRLALRDLPAGHFPGVPAMNRRDVLYANGARATLRHGMPVIDFTQEPRDAWDLRLMPFGRYPRWPGAGDSGAVFACGDVLNSDERPVEFAVLNRLSATMTNFAFGAVDDRRRPLRRAWAARRPKAMAPFSPPLPGQWMPRPYLAFADRYAAHLAQHARMPALRVKAEPQSVLFPAWHVGGVARELRPTALWWDLQPCCRYVDGELEAGIFPPIPLRRWDAWRMALPGDVAARRVGCRPTIRPAGVRGPGRRACEPAAHSLFQRGRRYERGDGKVAGPDGGRAGARRLKRPRFDVDALRGGTRVVRFRQGVHAHEPLHRQPVACRDPPLLHRQLRPRLRSSCRVVQAAAARAVSSAVAGGEPLRRLALVGSCAAALILGWVLGRGRLPWRAGGGSVNADAGGPTIEQVQSLAWLVTTRVTIADVREVELDGYTGGMRVALLVRGDVLLEVDLAAARLDSVDRRTRSAVLVLPQPRVTSARVDHERTKVFAVAQSGLWQLAPGGGQVSGELIDRAYRDAQRLLSAAADDPAVMLRARSQARDVVTAFFRAAGWSVDVRWGPPPPR